MSLEKQPTNSPEPEPSLPDGFASQEQYKNIINSEALRRIEDIEARRGMSPEEAGAYETTKANEFKKAMDATLMNIDDSVKRKAFRQRMEYITSSSASTEISTAMDKIIYEHGLQNRKEKKLPPPAPLRKPPKHK